MGKWLHPLESRAPLAKGLRGGMVHLSYSVCLAHSSRLCVFLIYILIAAADSILSPSGRHADLGSPTSDTLPLGGGILWGTVFGQLESKFDTCRLRLERILNGTETFRGISNETIGDFLYHGPVAGMKPEYAETRRDEFITITTQGMTCH